MIEIEIPKDIRKYETKLIGPLTTRQTICAVGACAIAFAVSKITTFVPQDLQFFVIALPALPFLLIGWVKPYGMHFEQFVASTFVSTILSPKYRKYKTKNVYATYVNNDNKKKKNKNKKKKPIKDGAFMPYN